MLESLQTMEGNIQQVVRSHNENMHSIKTAFVMTDMHLFVQRRIMNDMAHGRVKFVGHEGGSPYPIDPYAEVDNEWYVNEYMLAVHILNIVRFITTEPKPEAPPHVLGTVDGEPPAPADDYSFGGDYGGSKASESSTAP